MSESIPKCEHWLFGNIETVERRNQESRVTHTQCYERAILISFKTVDEFRAACKFIDPLLSNDQGAKP